MAIAFVVTFKSADVPDEPTFEDRLEDVNEEVEDAEYDLKELADAVPVAYQEALDAIENFANTLNDFKRMQEKVDALHAEKVELLEAEIARLNGTKVL